MKNEMGFQYHVNLQLSVVLHSSHSCILVSWHLWRLSATLLVYLNVYFRTSAILVCFCV